MNQTSHIFASARDFQPTTAFLGLGPLLATSYFALAKLGLHFAVIANNVTLIWPPTGLALFALLVFGVRLWPWVFLGALVTNLTTGAPFAACLAIALGNCLEALAGFYLLHLAGFNRELRRVRDVMLLAFLAAGLSTMVSATVGAFSLTQFQVIPQSAFGHAWLTWWMGDAMGNLLFTPLLLAWWFSKKSAFGRGRLVEGLALALSLLAVTEFVFGGQLSLFDRSLPLAFMTFPLLIWAAIRFGMLGATTAVFVMVGVILADIVYGKGLFAQGSALESLTLLWLYANFLAVTSMVLAASTGERKIAELTMRHVAAHDALTGLPNRARLKEDLMAAMARATRHGRQLAVLFMDLDRFKMINDSLGHSVGDQLLVSVSQRLRDCVRDTDAVFRHGGDEFVVLLEDLQHGEYAGKVADMVTAAMNRPFDVQGIALHSSASVGVSIYPRDGEDVETLLKNADIAMYRAKDLGRNNATFYSPEMNARAVERLVMENELREALHLRQFELHYQPQYDPHGMHINGCEALIRWRKSEHELVSPADFIPVLEETGLIKPVGAWVIETACAQLAEWHALGWASPRMSVNISCQQLGDRNLLNQLQGCLHRRNLRPEWLELEITESMLVRHDPATAQILQGFVDLGLRLAVDDFGTGYSSLSYLHRMSIDTLKVDRAFVKNIPGNEDSEAIARAIIALGKSMRLDVVAEGVETTTQAEFLRKLGCDLLQGYLFSKPVPAADFQRLLDGARPQTAGPKA